VADHEIRPFSDVLGSAASLIRALSDNNQLAQQAADEIESLAAIEALGDISVNSASIVALTSDAARGALKGQTFLPRAHWLRSPDLFTFDPRGETFCGWRRPTAIDSEIITQFQVDLHNLGEDGSIDPDTADFDPVREYLSCIDLRNEDILICEVPFLPNVSLIHLSIPLHGRKMEALFYALRKNDTIEIHNFNHEADALHQLNKRIEGLQVAGNELIYLRYFLQIVRGGAGAFRLIEGEVLEIVRDILGRDPHLKASSDTVLADWHPPRFVGPGPEGGLLYAAYVVYAGNIFLAVFCVYANGTVTMIDDIPLLNEPIQGLAEG